MQQQITTQLDNSMTLDTEQLDNSTTLNAATHPTPLSLTHLMSFIRRQGDTSNPNPKPTPVGPREIRARFGQYDFYSDHDRLTPSNHDIFHHHHQQRMTPVLSSLNGSPLSRAGLLQPRSYVPSPSHMVTPHTPDNIRLATMELSKFPLATPPLPTPPILGNTSSANTEFNFGVNVKHNPNVNPDVTPNFTPNFTPPPSKIATASTARDTNRKPSTESQSTHDSFIFPTVDQLFTRPPTTTTTTRKSTTTSTSADDADADADAATTTTTSLPSPSSRPPSSRVSLISVDLSASAVSSFDSVRGDGGEDGDGEDGDGDGEDDGGEGGGGGGGKGGNGEDGAGGATTPKGKTSHSPNQTQKRSVSPNYPSGLSLLLARQTQQRGEHQNEPDDEQEQGGYFSPPASTTTASRAATVSDPTPRPQFATLAPDTVTVTSASTVAPPTPTPPQTDDNDIDIDDDLTPIAEVGLGVGCKQLGFEWAGGKASGDASGDASGSGSGSGEGSTEATPLLRGRVPSYTHQNGNGNSNSNPGKLPTTPIAIPSPTLLSKSLSKFVTKSDPGSNTASNTALPLSASASTKTKAQQHLLSLSTLTHALRESECAKLFTVGGVEEVVVQGIKALPAVLLGLLLNVLDGVSYGMIIFPSSGVFADLNLGPMGVSMFFVSTVIAQLVYTFGGSGFAGANGSMMIEVVPFFRILAMSISQQIGEDRPREIIATTLVAYSLSSILTGITFFLLGALKLGTLIGFFPRHILVGCIGGVGAFLIETGFTVSMRIDDDDFTMTWDTFEFMFLDKHNLVLWLVPLMLAVLLRLITHRYRHQLIFPLYFLVIPILFYIIVAATQADLGALRKSGWVFDMGDAEAEAWYEFYSYFELGRVQFGPLWSTLPTQFALLFFNILHPPLNVPALSVSLNEDVDTNKELVAHGYSNLLSGFIGAVPNYLVYVNTLLFYRVGGGTRIAGFLLAVATAILLFIGTGPIAYIPVLVVGSLIFVLGIDLVKEAVWDTRHRVSRMEYITIWSIIFCMTVWDFVIGVLFGIVMSCFFFVIQNSQRDSIRALHTGETAISTVRRPGSQRAYIREVSKQTTLLRLQGFLFFGTITRVEETIRNIIQGPAYQRNPVRFLVLDLTHVPAVDMSSAEAFVRVQRLLAGKHVTLVFCGFEAESPVGKALGSVGVLGAEGVELFASFNDAMEWTENAYLKAWFRSHKAEASTIVIPGRQDADIVFHQSVSSSPRLAHLQDAGNRTIANELLPRESGDCDEPVNTLFKTFSSFPDVNYDDLRSIAPYLERQTYPTGVVLWKQGDSPDGLYFIESGVLRAMYKFAEYSAEIEESMVPGTVAGELSALSGLARNATAVVEMRATLWKLSDVGLKRLERDDPAAARKFMALVLKAAKVDYDTLLSALAIRQ